MLQEYFRVGYVQPQHHGFVDLKQTASYFSSEDEFIWDPWWIAMRCLQP